MGKSSGHQGPSAATGDRLGVHVKQTEQLLIAAKTRALRPHGLTVPQYAALVTIAGADGLSAAQVARACLVTPQTIGGVLTNLADRGLIERTRSTLHSGVLVCRATGWGRQLAAEADRSALAIECSLDALFPTAARRAEFVNALAALRNRLQSWAESPPTESPPAESPPAESPPAEPQAGPSEADRPPPASGRRTPPQP